MYTARNIEKNVQPSWAYFFEKAGIQNAHLQGKNKINIGKDNALKFYNIIIIIT